MKFTCSLFLKLACVFVFMGCKVTHEAQDTTTNYWMYLATSNQKAEDGIAIYEWHPQKGELVFSRKSNALQQSKYIAIHGQKNRLYSVNKGMLSTFRISKDATLKLENEFPYGKEKGGFIALDNSKQFLLSSLYASGKFMTFQLDKNGNTLTPITDIQHTGKGVNLKRQKSAHPHMAMQPKNSSLVFVPDLGDDKVYTYTLKSNGQCVASEIPYVKLPDGVGPRHLAFHPTKKIVYIIAEMASEMYAYNYHPKKGITDFINKTSMLPSEFKGFSTSADIAITANGKFLYAANRGHNSIAICEIDEATGAVRFKKTVSSNGKIPREFTIDPTGNYLLVANQNSNNVCVFAIEHTTGDLTLKQNIATGKSPQGFGFIKK